MAKSFAKFWGFFSKKRTEGIRCFKFFSFIFRRIFVVSLKPLKLEHTNSLQIQEMLMINLLFYESGCRVRVYDVLHLLQQRHVLGPAHPRILLRPPRLHPLHQLRRIHGPRSRNRRTSLHRIRINNLFSKFIWRFRCILDERLLFFFCPEKTFRC